MCSGREPVQVCIRRAGTSSNNNNSSNSSNSVFTLYFDSGSIALDEAFTVQPKTQVVLTVAFSAASSGHFSETFNVFVNGKPVPYAAVTAAGWAVAPYLAFSDAVVRPPIAPLGVPASAMVFVRAVGYGDTAPTIRAEAPVLASAAPIEIIFPEGQEIAREALPVVFCLASDTPVSFDVPVAFYDDRGTRCVETNLSIIA